MLIPDKKYFKNLIKPLAYALSYYTFIIGTYSIFNRIIVPRYEIYFFLDDYIPFVEEMLIPYLLWFPYISLPALFFLLFSKKNFYQFYNFMYIATLLCFIIYYLFPNGQSLRPETLGENVFSRGLAILYSIDQPTNVLPSMHVLNSLAIHFAFLNCEYTRNKKIVVNISLILLILITLSTMMIKQHSILDVLASLIIGALLYRPIFKS